MNIVERFSHLIDLNFKDEVEVDILEIKNHNLNFTYKCCLVTLREISNIINLQYGKPQLKLNLSEIMEYNGRFLVQITFKRTGRFTCYVILKE